VLERVEPQTDNPGRVPDHGHVLLRDGRVQVADDQAEVEVHVPHVRPDLAHLYEIDCREFPEALGIFPLQATILEEPVIGSRISSCLPPHQGSCQLLPERKNAG